MAPQQLPFDLATRPALGREDFFVSDSNRDAVGWIDKWPAWPAPALVIYGPPASGKTHLGAIWKQRAGEAAVFIDDARRVIGDKAEEEKLFHLYNKGTPLLLAAETPAAAWDFALPDLKSRLVAAPAAEIGAPDDALLAVVMAKMFSDRQVFVAQGVVSFALSRMPRSFAALRDLVDRIDRKALAEKRPVTVPLVRELL